MRKRMLLLGGALACILAGTGAFAAPFETVHGTEAHTGRASETITSNWLDENEEVLADFLDGTYVIEYGDGDYDHFYGFFNGEVVVDNGAEVSVFLEGSHIVVIPTTEGNERFYVRLRTAKSKKLFFAREPHRVRYKSVFDARKNLLTIRIKPPREMLGLWYRLTVTITLTKDADGNISLRERHKSGGVLSGGSEDQPMGNGATMVANDRTFTAKLRRVD